MLTPVKVTPKKVSVWPGGQVKLPGPGAASRRVPLITPFLGVKVPVEVGVAVIEVLFAACGRLLPPLTQPNSEVASRWQ
jgi:hypothetical protein